GMKKLIVAIMALTVIFTIAACSKKEESTPAATTPAPTTSTSATPAPNSAATPAGTAGTKELNITASNWKFDSTEYKVKAGETYKITLTNSSGTHGIKGNGDLKLNLTAGKTIEYK